MALPKLVDSKVDLYNSTRHFDRMIRIGFHKLTAHEQNVMGNSFARARAWIAYPDGKGSFILGFSKIVGHPSVKTVAEYDRCRIQISGSDTERVIKSFGVGTDYNVGAKAGKSNRHPDAEKAVKDFCKLVGRTPNNLARVRIMPVPDTGLKTKFERTKAYEVVLAALLAANLNEVQRRHLHEESAA